MNKKELRAFMARYGDTGETLSEALGIASGTLSGKLNGWRDFTQTEIAIIIRRYLLTPEDVIRIFFCPSGVVKEDATEDTSQNKDTEEGLTTQ